ncbi:MAG: hypothetical protein V1738_00910 [Patescibacteria group bacterium]
MRFGRYPKPKSSGAIFFVFVGVVGTVIIIAVSMGLGSTRRIAVNEYPALEAERLVADAILPIEIPESAKRLEIPLTAEPTMVVAYRSGDAQVLGLVRLDRRQGRYVMLSHLPIVGGSDYVLLPDMKIVETNWGSGLTIELRWPLIGGRSNVVTFIQLDGDYLRQIRVQQADGFTRLEKFKIGEISAGNVELTNTDLDGDGVAELTFMTISSSGKKSAQVYRWTIDRLVWNEHWSQALSARVELFPEPIE